VNKKFINDTTGLRGRAHPPPRIPDVLFAASYQRIRGPYFLQSGGKGSALWKSTDGGETWTEVKGGGFPETMKGRIEVAIALSNPDIMYAMVEADTAPNPRPAPARRQQERRAASTGRPTAAAPGSAPQPDNVRPFYYSQVRVHPEPRSCLVLVHAGEGLG
jgi:hypothetical protein